jgi:hypothetical protein
VELGPAAHMCNPRYLGSRDRRIVVGTSLCKKLSRPYLEEQVEHGVVYVCNTRYSEDVDRRIIV